MFYIIGVGPAPGFITEKAAQILREADCVFYEDYTGPIDVETLRRYARSPPTRLTRRDLEDESGRRVLECLSRGKTAVLATAGDPMLATSHAALISIARSRGYSVEVVPGVSIVCAAFSASCLSIYKLGGVATVTYPRGGVYSARPYELVEQNLARGLHTLLLLDVREDGVFMPPRDAAEIMLKLEEREKRGVFDKGRPVVVVPKLGWGGRPAYLPLGELLGSDLEGPAVFIVPGGLSPVERECIEALSVLKSR
ncbi:SAM-dependent methyltransferase [Pyrobaculum neutrophilum]|uniref:Diphthine synthase n=1 Tax=Pyrobaculum neutrophilum (strain DSM 2338 / JCM 9278 / NBRC 100436 / V24Sta) TaxID=444157 RepID=DPHB_PYRNV|nr:SAM-dependent methyltransferase [Pyrobaculum neutrophilum]B1YAU2.1 RecName: Full=Diphthine synthase; AltName: Full=Diphthamide biosynthesis methyltransferase [Pyrobaculum neutrophilum V24Sta]ACB39171.1 Diphthine synthase [Pyrobaculum neutrophilum V24Sta]